MFDLQALRSALVALLGADRVLDNPLALYAYSHDFWLLDLQRRLHGAEQTMPAVVVQARSHEDVVKTVRFANEQGVPLVPYGAGSGVCGGAKPPANAIVLDLSRLTGIVKVNDKALTVTVRAGMRGGEFEAQLNKQGYSMGHFPQSLHLSSVGGWVATRASGQFSTKYGSIEDMVVSLKAVLPDGTTISTKNVPRSATGPDLRTLLIGSEGTLAVVTEVTYKIHPLPEAQGLHAFRFDYFEEGLEAIRTIVRHGWRPAMVRLYDQAETKRHFGNSTNAGCLLLILSEGPKALVKVEQEACYQICYDLRGFDWGEKPVKEWLEHRFDIPHVYELAAKKGIVFDTIEVSANWDKVDQLYQEVVAGLKSVPGVLAASAHSSHSYQQGTCLYFTFAVKKPCWLPRIMASFVSGGRYNAFNRPEDMPEIERRYAACWQAVMQAVLANGGTISHHHGVGKVRLPWMEQELGSGYEVLKRIKAAIDPNGIMNPGTLFAAVDGPQINLPAGQTAAATQAAVATVPTSTKAVLTAPQTEATQVVPVEKRAAQEARVTGKDSTANDAGLEGAATQEQTEERKDQHQVLPGTDSGAKASTAGAEKDSPAEKNEK